MIEKRNLKHNTLYIGISRHARQATWDARTGTFVYTRYTPDGLITETTYHIEDVTPTEDGFEPEAPAPEQLIRVTRIHNR